ncbi:MAG: RpiB/LacA/LacB family sugar-phosphate isomerase [Candidatus Binatia bacterium]
MLPLDSGGSIPQRKLPERQKLWRWFFGSAGERKLVELFVASNNRQDKRKGGHMRVGIATDHGGFSLKEELLAQLRAGGHEVVDFGAHSLNEDDDYPDYVVPLAQAVAASKVERGVAVCGSGVGASVCANKIPGVRAALVSDHFSVRQGVEDDDLNILCMGGRTVGPAVAWNLVQTFLAAEFSQAERHLRRLGKVASLERKKSRHEEEGEN